MAQRRHIWRWILPALWLALTIGCSLAHWYAWSYPDQLTGTTGSLDALSKQVSNSAQTVNAPAWFVAWFVFHRYVTFESALVVNGVGFAFWLGLAALVIAARKRLIQVPRVPAASTGEPSPALSRRAFLTDSVLVTGTACAGAAGVYASFVTPWSLRLTKHECSIPGLPGGLDGLRLVQITDTHLGPRIPASFVRDAVEMALSLKPDLHLLTGDFVHMGITYIEPAAALFRPLAEARAGCAGVLAVMGNHDHYADAARMSGALEAQGVRVLHNACVFLDSSRRELARAVRSPESLAILGVDDLLEGRPDLVAAAGDVPEEMARVLLSHNPDFAEDASLAGRRIDLMISGHTHGGQVRLPVIGSPLIPSRFGQKYAYGMIPGPHCPVLVSAGVGMSLLPVRLGIDPEIVEITLRRA